MYDKWKEWTREHTLNGQRIREAIRPSMVRWVDRRWGHLSYRLTQVMTGHGCFGQFLHKIGREDTPECHHCPARVDSAQHTLAECVAWEEERNELKWTIGNGLDLPRVIEEMLKGEHKWKAVVNYCEKVLLKKEEAERIRRGEIPRAAPQQQRERKKTRGNSTSWWRRITRVGGVLKWEIQLFCPPLPVLHREWCTIRKQAVSQETRPLLREEERER